MSADSNKKLGYEEILKVAYLAKLKINTSEATLLADQLSKVISHFDEISSIDTKGVEPLTTPVDLQIYHREDFVKMELTTEELLKNAPDKQGQLFKVPPVV